MCLRGSAAARVGGTVILVFLAGVPKRACSDTPCPTIKLCCRACSLYTAPRAGRSCGSASVAYDLVQGTLAAYAVFVPVSGEAQDDYTVTSVPPGSGLTFRARLDVQASACASSYSYGRTTARLAEGSNEDRVTVSPYEGCYSVNDTLEITLTHFAGEPFRLTLEVGFSLIEGTASGSVQGRLSFLDLPPGAVITSCQGFRQEIATPARTHTWGQLKAQYR